MAHYPTTQIQNIVIGAFDAESALNAQFPGGVYPVLPRAGKGPSATPNAFWGPENPAESGKLKNTLSVLDGGDVPAPNGVGRGGYTSFPLVYAYVKPDSSGDTALNLLQQALFNRFRRGISFPYVDADGHYVGLEIVTLERQPLRDGDDFGYPDRQFTIWRLQATRVSTVLMT